MNPSTLFHPSPRRWMNKKTQARMENIRNAQRLIKPQERGVAEQIEKLIGEGCSATYIATKLNVEVGYVARVQEAMERRIA